MSGISYTTDRYRINGVLDTNKSVLQNLEALASSAGSWLSYDSHEGLWGITINKPGASVASFNDSNIIGSITLNGTGLTDLYNSVKVDFPHIDLNDERDFVQIDIPSGDRNANEPDNTLQITYDLINDPVVAQQLGFIELKQSRIDKIIKFTTDFSMFGVKAGDIIDVTNSIYGFDHKLFRITSVVESDAEAGDIQLSITALEYDATVYDEDFTRYTVSNATGITTVGNIGIPGTPTVTKFEANARPHVLIETTAPTGIVEQMEYWYTTDTAIVNDSNRTYYLLGTQRPTVGNIFAYGTQVRLDTGTISSGNVIVKTRGVNSQTSGPFSATNGFVYTPLQTTQAISSSTVASDGSGLLTALSVLSLLSKTDGLFSGNSAVGGMFDKMFEVFKDATGYDLRGNAGNIASVTTGNVSSINKTINSGNFSSNIAANSSPVLLNTISFNTNAGSGVHNIRVFQDVNSSGCVGGRGSDFSEHEDRAGLNLELYQGNTLISSTSTGGLGVTYWQDFTLESVVNLTGYTNYSLKIYGLYNPGLYTTDYQTSDTTYTVTKFG